jgi:hypothetical protein
VSSLMMPNSMYDLLRNPPCFKYNGSPLSYDFWCLHKITYKIFGPCLSFFIKYFSFSFIFKIFGMHLIFIIIFFGLYLILIYFLVCRVTLIGHGCFLGL